MGSLAKEQVQKNKIITLKTTIVNEFDKYLVDGEAKVLVRE